MKLWLTVFMTFFLSGVFAKGKDSAAIAAKEIAELEKSFNYKTGLTKLTVGSATLNIPEGFRFLGREDAQRVLTDLWGNPPKPDVEGMIVPANIGVTEGRCWAFVVTYDAMGYVKDDDADDINYDDMLKDLKKETAEESKQRLLQKYESIELIGWASKPFYDKEKKVLHWAQEIKFGNSEENTLNYNLRVLGRKGVYVLNAVGSMSDLPAVKSNIDKILGSVKFDEGAQYKNFDSKVDDVAAWTVGGLVAGKVLTKVGLLAGFAKFWKIIALAVAGVFGGLWRKITGRRKESEEVS